MNLTNFTVIIQGYRYIKNLSQVFATLPKGFIQTTSHWWSSSSFSAFLVHWFPCTETQLGFALHFWCLYSVTPCKKNYSPSLPHSWWNVVAWSASSLMLCIKGKGSDGKKSMKRAYKVYVGWLQSPEGSRRWGHLPTVGERSGLKGLRRMDVVWKNLKNSLWIKGFLSSPEGPT